LRPWTDEPVFVKVTVWATLTSERDGAPRECFRLRLHDLNRNGRRGPVVRMLTVAAAGGAFETMFGGNVLTFQVAQLNSSDLTFWVRCGAGVVHLRVRQGRPYSGPLDPGLSVSFAVSLLGRYIAARHRDRHGRCAAHRPYSPCCMRKRLTTAA
jgi:hypothetical protein